MCFRKYRHERTIFSSFSELNYAIYQSKQGMVFTDTYVLAWVVRSASLSYNDVTSDDILATINLNTKSFGMRFATVVRTTSSFFVCHFL